MATIRPLMKKPPTTSRQASPDRQIALVCVSPHKHADPLAKEPDKLTMVRGKWAWCPSGATAGHEWKPVASGSLDALRVKLVEVSRLVDVALNSPRMATPKTDPARKSRQATGKPKTRGRRR